MVKQNTRPMTSSPVVCLIGETEAIHFTPHSESFLHSTPHSQSFPHSNTSVSPSLTPIHHSETFPHSYTTQSLKSFLIYENITMSFPRSYTTLHKSFPPFLHNTEVLPSMLHNTACPSSVLQ
ncbi:hypothetical protein Hamer_G031647 [Homarus americanus]|uniref:Uncharacterized protein n=1 Tax=Homarus americanus TaxID=6706 RepID=A0A8J5MKM5_HOMAM|nr:hypothetical protein Hamer_G031647 [Homarus americanus]